MRFAFLLIYIQKAESSIYYILYYVYIRSYEYISNIILLLMKTFVVEMFNNLYKITVADAHMKSTDLIELNK